MKGRMPNERQNADCGRRMSSVIVDCQSALQSAFRTSGGIPHFSRHSRTSIGISALQSALSIDIPPSQSTFGNRKIGTRHSAIANPVLAR
jgi:hypothetical protein